MPQKWALFVVVGGLAWAFASTPRAGNGPEPAAMAASASRQTPAPRPLGDELVLERGSAGQFHLTAQVDGADAEFLVDTGADIVALTVDEAERLGVAPSATEFQPLMRTASGTGNGALIKLARLEVAGAEFRDVDAVVMEGLEVNLLGQSVLRRLGTISLEGDRMMIQR